MATAATIDVMLRANTAQYRQAMADAGRVANRHLGEIQREAEKTARVMGQLRTAAAGVFTAQVARSGITALLDTAKAQQALTNSMKASVGSAQLAGDALSFVSQAAKELGLDYQTAAMGFQRLTASATANGIAMKDQQQLFLEVSRAATSMQIAPAQVDRAMTALSQSFSKGRFQAEELRQQLAEAIPGVVPRFQKAVMEMTKGTDLANKSFDQLLQGGLLDVKTFLPAMTQAFAEMGASWQDGARSLQAETNRLGNAWRQFKLDLADGPFSDTVVAGIRAATVALDGLGAVMPVLVPAATALAAVKLGQSAAGWVRGLNAAHAATLAQATAAQAAAAALVDKTRREMLDAQATAARARAAYGGSIAADLAAVQATNAHSRALAAHTTASQAAAAASARLATAGKAALAFFGGPAGLAFMVASTAASWLLFRNNASDATSALVDWSGAADQAIGKFKELNAAQQAGALLRLQEDIGDGYKDIARQIDALTSTAFNSVGQSFALKYREDVKALEAQFRAGKIGADAFSEGLSAANQRLLEGRPAAERLRSGFVEGASAAATLSVEVDRQRGMLGNLTGAQHGAAAAARDHASGMIELSRASQEATNKITAAIASLPGQIERVGKSARDLAKIDVRDWFRELAKDGVNFADQSNEQVKQYMVQGSEYIAQQTKLAAAQEAFNKQQQNARAGARESASLAKQQESQYQSIVDRINRQIALDKEAMLVNDKMTAAQKLQVLVTEELRSAKNKLSESEQQRVKVLLAEAVAQGAAQKAMEDAKRGAEELLRLRNELKEAAVTRRMGNAADLMGIGRGDDAVEQMRRQIDLQEEYQRKVRDLNMQAALNPEMKASYDAQVEMLSAFHEQALREEEDYQQRRKEMMADGWNGARAAMEDYIAQAEDVAGQVRNVMGNAMRGLEDVFVDFFTKGKADWRAFFDDIHAQIIRFVVRQQLANLTKKLFGGGDDEAAALSSAAAKLAASAAPLLAAATALSASAAALAAAGLSGGVAGAAGAASEGGWFASALGKLGSLFPGKADGGYTGPGGKHDPAGLVHRGEVVWSQVDVARAGGVAAVEAMRRGIRGYAEGGPVGGSRMVSLGSRRPGVVATTDRSIVQNFTTVIEGRLTARTEEQLEIRQGRAARRAMARTG